MGEAIVTIKVHGRLYKSAFLFRKPRPRKPDSRIPAGPVLTISVPIGGQQNLGWNKLCGVG
jgi:hypothetical protein